MIPQEILDQIIDANDIVEVISGYVPLKKTGRSFKACCPFHDEKTPSFVVSPEKQIFHCFGCGAGGNSIGFVMKYENLTFPEAAEQLAKKAGIEIPRSGGRDPKLNSEAASLYELNKVAASFYQNTLVSGKDKTALDYLKKRGVSTQSISEFRIGYAPDAWDSLRNYCQKKKISQALLRKAGLTILSTKGKGDYDRFRNRIIFPIFNDRGSILGFGARVLDNSLPKYINSPETIIYNKSNVLYGLNVAKKGIREKGFAIIVEGYTDVIVPYQYGANNIVAASGTALTPQQVRSLKKYTSTVVILFDSDKAGEAASLRGLDILIENDMNLKVVSLPGGEDPDSFIRKNGKEKFDEIIKEAKDLLDYKLDIAIKRFGTKDISSILDEMLPTISKINNMVIQSEYLKKLAQRLGIHEASLRVEMKKVKPDYTYRHDSSKEITQEKAVFPNSQIHLLGLSISKRKIFNKIEEELGLDAFTDQRIKDAILLIRDLYSDCTEEITSGKLLNRAQDDEDVKNAIMQAINKVEIVENYEKVLEDCILMLKKETKDKKLKELTVKLKKAQETNNENEIKDLVTRISNIHKEKVV